MRLRSTASEEFLCGSKGVCLKPGRTQQQFYRAAVTRVILNDSDDALGRWHFWRELLPIIANLRSLRYCPFGQIWEKDEQVTESGASHAASQSLAGAASEELAEPLDRSPQLSRR